MTEPIEPFDPLQYVSYKDVKELADMQGCTCLACQSELGRYNYKYGNRSPSRSLKP